MISPASACADIESIRDVALRRLHVWIKVGEPPEIELQGAGSHRTINVDRHHRDAIGLLEMFQPIDHFLDTACDESRQIAAVIEVRMGENDRVDALRINRKQPEAPPSFAAAAP